MVHFIVAQKLDFSSSGRVQNQNCHPEVGISGWKAEETSKSLSLEFNMAAWFIDTEWKPCIKPLISHLVCFFVLLKCHKNRTSTFTHVVYMLSCANYQTMCCYQLVSANNANNNKGTRPPFFSYLISTTWWISTSEVNGLDALHLLCGSPPLNPQVVQHECTTEAAASNTNQDKANKPQKPAYIFLDPQEETVYATGLLPANLSVVWLLVMGERSGEL